MVKEPSHRFDIIYVVMTLRQTVKKECVLLNINGFSKIKVKLTRFYNSVSMKIRFYSIYRFGAVISFLILFLNLKHQ